MNLTQRKTQTVRLDGDRVRVAREQRGLTQLYIAEVVGVTVDTVSRWENNRTQAVRRENAEALAAALEVEPNSILRPESAPGTDPSAPVAPRPSRGLWLVAASATALLVAAGVLLWRQLAPPPFVVEAERRLPAYTPPGTTLPVTVRIRVLSGKNRRLLLRETLPPGWEFIASVPPQDQGPSADGTVKWILPPMDGEVQVAYVVRAPPAGQEGSRHFFRGTLVTPEKADGEMPVRGPTRIDLEYLHWADEDADFMISDAEVLDALERLESAAGLPLDPRDLRRLWGAQEYVWVKSENAFRPRAP